MGFLTVDMLEASVLSVGTTAPVSHAERKVISRRAKEALAEAKGHDVKLGHPDTGGGAQARWYGRCGAA